MDPGLTSESMKFSLDLEVMEIGLVSGDIGIYQNLGAKGPILELKHFWNLSPQGHA
jgi:hypothetical protein